MIPYVELAKELVAHVDDGRQCLILRTQNPARRDARLQSDGVIPYLFYTHSRTLDAAVITQNVGATLRKDEHLPELPNPSIEALQSCGEAEP
jgi:hypothetical protein